VDTNGIITTVAGNFHYGYSGDGGMATNACLSQPSSITVDPVGNLFFADAMNNRIRKVDINGVITTVAGNGIGDYSGNGNAATNASLNDPSGVAFDTVGNLYIADMNNNRIRKVLLYAEYPTLTLNNVTTNNMGNYSVIITNPSGSVTSSVVALTTQK
jgi:sugar lactone lactonase YvrE